VITEPIFSASLPAPLTEFVGRDRELREVTRLIADARLLTLTGAGGSGKTRLALAVASLVAERAGTEVAWVELASLSDAASLAADMAAVLGARAEGSESPGQAIVAALVERDVLLVLDNCEHLVEACAVLVEQLLRASPKLRVLATSREPLGVSGERSWLVPPLALPEVGATAADAFATGAAQLFVERARDV
jgi:predicted ATPase